MLDIGREEENFALGPVEKLVHDHNSTCFRNYADVTVVDVVGYAVAYVVWLDDADDAFCFLWVEEVQRAHNLVSLSAEYSNAAVRKSSPDVAKVDK